ncbi:bicarbonate transporter BicA [Oxynema aestuarii]|jgi:SulP family sulfate permease|uniref:SulP family inorganic anion transporter n=1 Tax=Oxynema aestuarii AP17 TaxID=2064643 RepID=A0A6H1TXC5_9CYAN|nr:SulP family inorganic anion transporter [Oxynema aestuarii]QIZ70797.1 SulP family inorganic anion transporter [Oxynema aestuarii AP17]
MQLTNRINLSNVRGDLFGGVTAAVIALPMALAFGVASGAGAQAGLYGAVLVGFFASLFGGTPTLISEPTGPMTVIMTAIVASLTAANPENGMAMAFTVVMMGGLFQILLGSLGLGKYITLMPYTVVSGFMSGIGLILIVLQIAPFLGHGSVGGVLATLQKVPELISTMNPAEATLGVMTVAILWLMPSKWGRLVPPQLVALILGTVLSLFFFGDIDAIRRIGNQGEGIPTGLPSMQMPFFTLAQIRTMLVDAMILGMLGAIDALLTSTIADSLTRTHHNSNKELIGQGIGNIMSGLFGGLPGAGATMGTVVNIQTGGRTALSGLTRAIVLMVVILGAADLTETIPMAVLAGIALKVGIDIIDWSFLKRAHHVSWKGALIMYGVIALTVLVDLMVAVGVGVFVANVLTIQRLSDLQAKDVKAITDADDEILLEDEEKALLQEADGRVLLFHLSGPMIFGVSKAISREQAVVDNYDVLILDLSDVPLLGVTSSLAIENAIQEAREKGCQVFIVGATGKIKKRLEKFGILDLIPPQNLLMDRRVALREAVAFVKGDAKEQNSHPNALNLTPLEES